MAKKILRQRKKSDRMASKGHPNPVDVHVGGRVRMRRTLLGLSQEALAESLGLTFQQVQKYERGANRVSSSRLFDLCRILKVPVAFFFDEMGGDVAKQSPSALQGKAPAPVNLELDPAAKRETLELVRAYYGIKDPAVRQKLTAIVRAVGASE
jgi:transcriptional regulator with XRE-family HTH domain